MQKFEFTRYARLLGEWVAFARRDLYVCPDGDGVICYGSGVSSNWGMQTHMKALSAFAVAASLEETEFRGAIARDGFFGGTCYASICAEDTSCR